MATEKELYFANSELRVKFVQHKYDLKVCDDGTLVQMLNLWTLSIALFLYKNATLFILRRAA
jgi:hypothetical protein